MLQLDRRQAGEDPVIVDAYATDRRDGQVPIRRNIDCRSKLQTENLVVSTHLLLKSAHDLAKLRRNGHEGSLGARHDCNELKKKRDRD
jgi:hypothetical protein